MNMSQAAVHTKRGQKHLHLQLHACPEVTISFLCLQEHQAAPIAFRELSRDDEFTSCEIV
jgi:hypothetical protein